MNKLRLAVITFSLLVCSRVKAQYYSHPDSIVLENRNTLGLYISPAVNFMMNSFAHNPRFGIQYKRWLTDYKRLRLSLVRDYIKFYETTDEFPINKYLSTKDSLLIVSSSQRNQQKTTLRAGLEWNSYSDNIDGFFGLDLIAGYKKDKYEMKLETYSWSKSSQYIGDTLYHFQLNQNQTTYPYAYNNTFIELGISPIIGWRFDIKDNFEFAVWASPEVTIAVPVSSEWLGDNPIPSGSTPDTEIEFRLRLLEMVLSYRF